MVKYRWVTRQVPRRLSWTFFSTGTTSSGFRVISTGNNNLTFLAGAATNVGSFSSSGLTALGLTVTNNASVGGTLTTTGPAALNGVVTHTPGTVTLSGSTQTPGFSSRISLAGSFTGSPNAVSFVVPSDVATPTGSSVGFNFEHDYGGGTSAGGKIGMNVLLLQSGGANADSADKYYTGGVFTTFARYTQPGSSASTPEGRVFGFNSVGAIQTGFTATNYAQVAGGEVDVCICGAGSSAAIRSGLTVADLNGIAQGFNGDNMIWLYGAGQPWRYGIMFGDTQNWPMDSTYGTMLGANIGAPGYAARPFSAKWGVDFSQVTFPSAGNSYAGGFIRSNNFSVDGGGTIQQGACYQSPSITGESLDCKGAIGTTVAISAAGSGYSTGGTSAEAVTTAYGGVYLVTTNGSGIPTGVTVLSEPAIPSSSTPTNPVATINLNRQSAGSGLTLTIGWNTTATILALNPSGGVVKVGSGGLSANGTAGTTCTGTPSSSFATSGGIVIHC